MERALNILKWQNHQFAINKSDPLWLSRCIVHLNRSLHGSLSLFFKVCSPSIPESAILKTEFNTVGAFLGPFCQPCPTDVSWKSAPPIPILWHVLQLISALEDSLGSEIEHFTQFYLGKGSKERSLHDGRICRYRFKNGLRPFHQIICRNLAWAVIIIIAIRRAILQIFIIKSP